MEDGTGSALASSPTRGPGAAGDSTHIVPPIISASRRLTARPRPVPPYLRVVEASTWLKAWNRRSIRSGGMPMPVSRTAEVDRDCGDRDRELPVLLGPCSTRDHHLTRFGELDRVAQQVDQDLPQPRDVADNGRRDVGGHLDKPGPAPSRRP